MNSWILIILFGVILASIGFVLFVGKYPQRKPLENSVFLIGIFIPVLAALDYSETLIGFFPDLTLIDLGAFYVIGMISGFFVALYLTHRQDMHP